MTFQTEIFQGMFSTVHSTQSVSILPPNANLEGMVLCGGLLYKFIEGFDKKDKGT